MATVVIRLTAFGFGRSVLHEMKSNRFSLRALRSCGLRWRQDEEQRIAVPTLNPKPKRHFAKSRSDVPECSCPRGRSAHPGYGR